jgi:hypothetical protein
MRDYPAAKERLHYYNSIPNGFSEKSYKLRAAHPNDS